MKILIIGAGGREHALAWRLRRDPDVSTVLMAPGNPGMAALGPCIAANLGSPEELLALAERERVDLTVVGPEAPLERGLADLFRAHSRPIVGPARKGAALECSKVHAKHFMERHGIPTAKFSICLTLDEALGAVRGPRFGLPVVIKADGLAAGKGVVIATTREEAEGAIHAAMVDRAFGDAGGRLVIEECLSGPEVSAFYLCDGRRALFLSTAQDHKRIWDDDRGPNTGPRSFLWICKLALQRHRNQHSEFWFANFAPSVRVARYTGAWSFAAASPCVASSVSSAPARRPR